MRKLSEKIYEWLMRPTTKSGKLDRFFILIFSWITLLTLVTIAIEKFI